jgi:intracellular sulfur oxidation DsrE/DsrF family protein
MLEFTTVPTPRRGFLGTVAAAAAAVGLGGSLPSRLAAESPSARSSNPDLEAWFGKIKGKHRQVFDSPRPAEGLPGVWPRVYLMTMADTYPGESITAVLIIRHDAIPLALNDAMWSKYKLGEAFNIKAGETPATTNIYATIKGLPIPNIGVAELVKTGVLVGACNMALKVAGLTIAKQTGGDADAIHKELVDNVLPGIQVVPSGVMAVGRAQEMGCKYCFAA